MGCADRSAIADVDEHTLIAVVRQSIPPGTYTTVARRRMSEGGFACGYWAALPLDDAPGPRVDYLRCERRQPSDSFPDYALRLSMVHSAGKIDSVLVTP